MRADVNLIGKGSRTHKSSAQELRRKNLNSFTAIARAIEGERDRQIDLIESGEKVVQETRRWDDT